MWVELIICMSGAAGVGGAGDGWNCSVVMWVELVGWVELVSCVDGASGK